MIDKFRKEYFFLSNFYPKGFNMNGKYYATSEHAYQALKAKNESDHELIRLQTSARMSKQIGQEITPRENWNKIKKDVMLDVLREKFKDKYLTELLKETEPHYLKEGNTWHDNFYGDCECDKCQNITGENWLGKLLIKVREGLLESKV